MKLVIDIPEEVYKKQSFSNYFGAWSSKLQETVENGTLLEQRTGHWILTKDGFECTECGCALRSRADLCQYCGAKMLKEGE